MLCNSSAFAFNAIPETSGYSGYVMAGAGYTETSSNMIAGTKRVDLTLSSTESLTEAPGTKSSSSMSLLGELRYTFSRSRTQLFVSQLFTDFIRYDVTNALGIRHEFQSIGTIGASYVFAAFVTTVWKDPYVVNGARSETDREQAGWRLSWEQLFGAPLALQYTQRDIEINEQSGRTQLALGEQQAQLLDRNGDLKELRLSYEWDLSEHHTLVPELLYDHADTAGKAMNAKRYGLKLTHTFLKKEIGLVLVTAASYTNADYDGRNPVFNKTREDQRYGLDLTYIQFGIFKNNRTQWALVTDAYYFKENTNIDFYDQKIAGINLSLLYRF